MSEKYWIQDFETQIDRLRVRFVTEGGNVESINVIQYEAFLDGEWHAVVRFDEAHGFFHRDLMSPTGVQTKSTPATSDKGVALTEAIAEIKANWQSYRKAYEDKYYGRD